MTDTDEGKKLQELQEQQKLAAANFEKKKQVAINAADASLITDRNERAQLKADRDKLAKEITNTEPEILARQTRVIDPMKNELEAAESKVESLTQEIDLASSELAEALETLEKNQEKLAAMNDKYEQEEQAVKAKEREVEAMKRAA